MDQREIDKVCEVLRAENQNRVVQGRECSLLQCVGALVQANTSLVEEYVRTILAKYTARFKTALALMHKDTPVKGRDESDDAYKTRLDSYYEAVVDGLSTYEGTRYVNVYLYAVATVTSLPVFVLMRDENRQRSWFHFPALFAVEAEELLPAVSGRAYLTLFMHRGMSACLAIDSRDAAASPPVAAGYIGMQQQSLAATSVENITVPEGLLRQRDGLRGRRIALGGLLDRDLLEQCSDLMVRKQALGGDTAGQFTAHRLDNKVREDFVEELVQSEAAFRIFCQFVIRQKRWDIFKVLMDDFDEDLVIREDSPELEASYITLPLDAEELRRALDIDKLRPWLGILKHTCQFQMPEGSDEEVVKTFVEQLIKSKNVFRHFCKILLIRREHALLECLGFGEVFRSAGTCPYLTRYVALKELERSILTRAQYVSSLKHACLANSTEIEERRGRVNWAVIGGSTTGVVGGVLAIVGLALTPVTAGLSLGLTIAGAAVGAASGVVSGGARGYEAFKQIRSVKDIKAIQTEISELEINIQENLRVVESLFARTNERVADRAEEGPSADLRGFLAVGSALRSAHGFVALGIAAARVGTTVAAVAASVLGPLSLVVDIGFLVEAGYNKKKGNKVTTAEQLRETAVIVEMKSRILKSIWRGNFKEEDFIVP